MIIDLHAHTYYSNCGKDDPEFLVTQMIKHGVQVFGICDHNYGIGDRINTYYDHIRSLAKKYADKIKVLCGIELCGRQGLQIDTSIPLPDFDYCLIEDLYDVNSVYKQDIVTYSKNFNFPKGIAHTDLFGLIKGWGIDALTYLKSLADNGIFWELNVNYDSIHRYSEHKYVKDFFNSPEQIELVKKSGLNISVGFDGHVVEDYNVDRVKQANEKLINLGIKNVANTLLKYL